MLAWKEAVTIVKASGLQLHLKLVLVSSFRCQVVILFHLGPSFIIFNESTRLDAILIPNTFCGSVLN